MGLYFGFVLKTGVIRDIFAVAEQSLHGAKAFFASYIVPPVNNLEMCKNLREDTPGQVTPGILQTMWNHVQCVKLREGEGRRMFRVMVFVFPSIC